MVQRGVDLALGSVNGVEATARGGGARLNDQADEWAEQARPQLDQEDARFQSERRQAQRRVLPIRSTSPFARSLLRS